MEGDLKMFKVEYFSNLSMDRTQILNWSLYDKTIFSQSLKWIQPQLEDDLKMLKVE